MPVTPFHFGPGLLLHAVAPRLISFTAFVAANVVIDLESAYFLITGGMPVHRTLHTFAVAPIVGIAVGWLVHLVWHPLEQRFALRVLTLRAALFGGMLGGVTHAVLDSIMHGDMRPMWPVSSANPILGSIDLQSLHLLCVVSGLIGLVVLGVRYWRGPVRA